MSLISESNRRAILVELPLPYHEQGDIQRIRNDIVLTKLIDDNYHNYLFQIITNESDIPTPCIFAYISELYSKSWNEAVLKNKFDANIIVFYQPFAPENFETFHIEKVFCPTESPSQPPIAGAEVLCYASVLEKLEAGLKRWKVVVLDDYPASGVNHPTYEFVAVGGSFDQLHNGHKKLLYCSLVVCLTQLTVGITADSMLTSKAYHQSIQNYSQRYDSVNTFVNLFKRNVDLNLVEISDPFGPTITDPRIQAIVVSSETITGAFKINELREERNMPALDILLIARSDSAILSSTFLRRQKQLDSK